MDIATRVRAGRWLAEGTEEKEAREPIIFYMKTFLSILAFIFASPLALVAQESASAPARPHLLGIAHIALYVHDVDAARMFYKNFLGYDEPFSLKNSDGTLHLTWIKINDHQFVELFPEKTPNTDRLVQISIETDNAEAMRLYLKSKGVTVPDKTSIGKSQDRQF